MEAELFEKTAAPALPPTIPRYTLHATDDPHLFRVVNRAGDWIVYYQDEKKLYLPAVNYILQYGFPKDERFYNYLLGTTKEASKQTLENAGKKGSRVHEAIRELIAGQTIAIDRVYQNELTGRYEALTEEEWDCLIAWVRWCEEARPEVIKHETSIWTEKHGYAGTIDFYGTIVEKGKRINVLLDWKTGGAIYDEHKLQTAAYAHALPKIPAFTGVVRLGTKHKCRYEMKLWDKKETKYHFTKFLASQSNFEMNHKEFEPDDEQIPTQLAVKIPTVSPKIKRLKSARKEKVA